jgi:hypothetical protein
MSKIFLYLYYNIMSSDSEDHERLLNERITEREARRKGFKKEYDKMNSNFKQPVYTSFLPDTTPAHHQSVFQVDLDVDKTTESSSNNVPVSLVEKKPVPTLAELASRKKRLHKGGRKSKKNRRRGSRRRSRSSRR